MNDTLEADDEVRSGISRNSFMALLYATFVFSPAVIYLSLMTGIHGGLSLAWFTLVLWVELGRISGIRITQQEAFMIFALVGVGVFTPYGFVYREYFRQSDIVGLFGLTEEIPDWWAPHPNTGIFEMRTLFHSAWVTPIGIAITWWLTSLLLMFVVASLGREILIEVENLPFPMQNMQVEAISTLTAREERSSNILFLCALFGFVYGFILYAFPFLTKVWTGTRAEIIPIPWMDMTSDMENIGLKGAIFGVATDLLPISLAFILPFSRTIAIFIGSFAVYFIGNWLIVQYNFSPIPWWEPGMNAAMILQRSMLYFWAAPLIGMTLSVGIVPLFRHPKVLITALSSMLHPKGRRLSSSGRFSFLIKFLIPYAACVMIGVIFFACLAPTFLYDFFFLVIPLAVALPIVLTLIEGRMIGETGIGLGLVGRSFALGTGDLTNAIYLSTGYPGTDVWFVPNMWAVTGGSIVAQFKMAQLTKTSVWSYIKAYWLLLPVAMVVGFLFVELFWRMAPIPSAVYPGVAIFWPVRAIVQCLWIKGTAIGIFQPSWVLFGFIAGAGLFLLGEFTPIPLSMVAVVAGANTVTPYAITYLIGVVIAIILRKITGKEWWDKNKRIVSAGLVMGEGLAVALSVAVALAVNAIWVRPF